MAGVGGAAVPGRLPLAGTEAPPPSYFHTKSSSNSWHRRPACAGAGRSLRRQIITFWPQLRIRYAGVEAGIEKIGVITQNKDVLAGGALLDLSSGGKLRTIKERQAKPAAALSPR